MEKEFEALKAFYNNVDYLINDVVIENDEVNSCLITIKEQLPTIKQALTELQAIKEAKPSEAMEGLKHIKKYYVPQPCSAKTYDYLEIIEQSLLKAQEQEKVLEIIWKKNVDINEIKILLANLKHCDDIERCKRYNASRKVGYKLKQEEFDLLKRWCEKCQKKS